MKNLSTIIFFVFIQFLLISCKEQSAGSKEEILLIPVKTTLVKQGNIEQYIHLNGKTIYLKKNKITAPVSAYIAAVNVKYGDMVQKGDILFELQTKENNALNNTSDNLKVLASSGGIVSELNINQTGTYLVEGDLLCTIVENKDVMVQVNVPYEYNRLLKTGTQCILLLPDHTLLNSKITRILPSISETDQTQIVFLKPDSFRQLPENLNLTVQFVLLAHNNTLLIAKEAVMTNEKQNDFWLMKIQHDSLAIKVPVQKGIENDSLVEIYSPYLNVNDVIISEGAFGLPDSSVVKIKK
ncbi:MAG: HlyD family efflux transporter periplasmic adaptor subunit [Bacteroidales bacterium]|nr:HlyD family efflux transporter periplasmic adaptor subunit [Bacteroidales bacterium]